MSDREPDGFDRLGTRGRSYAERQAGNLADRPGRTLFGWALRIGVAILMLVIVTGVIGFAAGWFNAAKDVASPTNVREQYRAVIEGYNAMEAAAANACAAKNAAPSESGPTLVEDPAFAYKAQYRRIAVDYNRRQANLFEARKVGPKGYPRRAPALAQMMARVC